MTISDIRNILEAPYNRKVWKSFIQTQFTNNNLLANDAPLNLGKSDLYTDCYSLGNYAIDDYTKIGIFEIQLADKVNLTRNRVALRNLIKSITQQVAGAMVVFVQGEKWRFSYISKRKIRNKETNKVEDKETAPKRYTFLFGKGEKALTASIRFDKLIQKQQGNLYQFLTLNDFEEAFSVEKLSKDFFSKYKEIYEDLVEFITGVRYIKKGNKWIATTTHEAHFQLRNYFDNDEKQARDFCKRIMGRIVFLYFIQKKGWLAVPKDKTWGQGDMDYLFNLFDKAKYKESFYSEYLVPLFFDTLNNIDSQNETNELRFPYLNGGLFDKSQDFKYDKIALPSEIFEKLFNTFNNFNFTIYEDAPDEHTVAVDPEMLGHIFENLLEDNKAKGAFYTPKDIVHYMCRESLHNYIYTYTKNENNEDFKVRLKEYNDSYDVNIFNSTELKQIDRALEDVKICDPAIGSGAFPMGLLHEIYHLKIPIEDSKGFKAKTPADLKKHIIEESIYGVDIDNGAVDISRLRFWLSLVVDEVEPQPLPNLAFKIVCANTLIPLRMDESNINIAGATEIIREIEKVRHNYFDSSKEDKKHLERQFKNLQNKLWVTAKDWVTSKDASLYEKLLEFNPFEDNSCSWFDAWWMFGVKEGFDIVIGNPPYGAKLTKAEKEIFKVLYSDVHMRTPDTFNYFISKAFKLLKQNGVLSFIVPNNLLFQNENTKTRALLINTNYLKRVINLGDNAFENADVPTCIFIGLKNKKHDYFIDYSDNRKELIENIDFFKSQKAILNTEINDVPDMVIGVSSSGVKLMKDIEAKSYTINEIASEVASGIGTGGDKIFRISKEFAEINNFEKELLKPVLVGGEIDKYKINDTKHCIIYSYKKSNTDKYKNIFAYLKPFEEKLSQKRETKNGTLPWWCLHWHRNPELFDGEKIILRQTSDSIRATYDNQNYYCIDSINIIKLNKQYDISYKYALMALNSKMNNLVYKNITQEEGRVFAQVKPQNVRKLFIPKIGKEDQKVFEILCDYLMFLNNDAHQPVNQRIDNKALAHYIQQIADACIVELIYEAEMQSQKVNILEFVRNEITSFEDFPWEVRQAREIFYAHQKWTMPQSEVRNRLKIISLMCPDTAGKILNANEED